MSLIIELLTRSHDRRGFDCGNTDLNRYLLQTARQHIDKGISRTFVLVDDEDPSQILGFYTLAFCEIFINKLPVKWAKKLPERPPATKLARLAVVKHMQQKGLGTHMMIDAMDKVLKVSEHIGIIGFFVDAKNDEAASFYSQFGFIPLPDSPLELFLPIETLRQSFQ